MPYILTFCRIVTGLVFAASFWGKAQNMNQFVQTITNFKLLPSRYSQPLMLLFLLGELTVVSLILVGETLLPIAFGLATILLAAFTVALISVLRRNIQTACNCFGSSSKTSISHHDVWCNLGLLLIAATGFGVSSWVMQNGGGITAIETLLISLSAIAFLLIWLNLRDILQLFQIA
ncbi:MAG: DoxX family membrane protein [Chloroflexi bacterium]|nr:DoxX family membrane protein [Chloroflexota bacterium]